jgi:hypothetical protein
MGTAFSSSMFGLLGALLLSLLDIGLSKAYQGFLEDLYLLLKAYTKTAPEKTLGGAAYTQGVIEQLAENMYTLQQVIIASEEGKNLLIKSIQNMNERLLALSEEVKENQAMVKKFSHHTYELQQALKFISQQLSTTVLDETSKQSLRSIDTTLKQLLVESHETKNKMTQELRSEIRLVARTLSALANQDAAA